MDKKQRDKAILQMWLAGDKAKDIADVLGVTKRHVDAVMYNHKNKMRYLFGFPPLHPISKELCNTLIDEYFRQTEHV